MLFLNKLNQEIQSIRTTIEVLEKELGTMTHTKEEENELTDKIIILRLELRKLYNQALGGEL